MKRIAYSFFVVFALALSSQLYAEPVKPELLVVKFHADWCGSCRVLGPEMDKAREQGGLDTSSVLFVTLDLTDAAKRHQSALLASTIGIGAFYKENNGKTGFAILVDPKSGEIKGKLTKSMDSVAIVKAVGAHI